MKRIFKFIFALIKYIFCGAFIMGKSAAVFSTQHTEIKKEY